MKNYETIVEEETLRETASWPEGSEFETLEPMMRITLNIILRAIFGAAGAELETLRRIIPPWVTLGSRLAVLPTPPRDLGQWSPWARLARYRSQYDSVIDRLIDQAHVRPGLRRPHRCAGSAAAQHLRGRLRRCRAVRSATSC